MTAKTLMSAALAATPVGAIAVAGLAAKIALLTLQLGFKSKEACSTLQKISASKLKIGQHTSAIAKFGNFIVNCAKNITQYGGKIANFVNVISGCKNKITGFVTVIGEVTKLVTDTKNNVTSAQNQKK